LNENALLRRLRNYIPLTITLHGERFVFDEAGIRAFTPLFLVLILVEVSDLIFAVDSIPAIFAVTGDPFIVFTANTFAILGLRAMYFLLADVSDKFYLLGYGLAVIVTLVGIKMLVMHYLRSRSCGCSRRSLRYSSPQLSRVCWFLRKLHKIRTFPWL
jgi:tellurite resistance protein TerC